MNEKRIDRQPPHDRLPLKAALAGIVVLLASLAVVAVRGVEPSGDGQTFEQLAINLINHRRYTWGDGVQWEKHSHIPKERVPLEPCSDYAPLHPAVLALMIMIGRGTYLAVGIANAFWLAGAAVFTLLAAAEVSKDRRVPLIAGALFAATIPLYANLTTFYREPLYILLLMAAVWALLRAGRPTAGAKSQLVAGGLWGLSILCKPVMLVFVPFYLLWVVLVSEVSRRERARRAAIVMLAAVSVVAPWVLRNVYHNIGPVIASQGGQNFMCTVGDGSGNRSPELYPDTEDTFWLLTSNERATLSESEISSLIYRRRLERVAAQPMLAVRILARNTLMLAYFIDSTTGRVHLAYVMAFPFFVLGAIESLRSKDAMRAGRMLLLGVVSVFCLGLVLHMASPGYRLPVEPVAYIIAALGVVWADERLTARPAARRLMWIGWPALCMLFFLLYTPTLRSGVARMINELLG